MRLRALLPSIALLLLSGLVILGAPQAPIADPIEATLTVHYSPKGGCEAEVCKQLDAAKKTVRVLAYNFNSVPMKESLIAAHKRGVDVQCVVDHVAASEKGCIIPELVKAGIHCWTDKAHKIAHNKVVVIDGKTVLTGSFNFSENAESHNAENLLTIHSPALAKLYAENWALHQDHSDRVKKE